jgi:hypothetical protein
MGTGSLTASSLRADETPAAFCWFTGCPRLLCCVQRYGAVITIVTGMRADEPVDAIAFARSIALRI